MGIIRFPAVEQLKLENMEDIMKQQAIQIGKMQLWGQLPEYFKISADGQRIFANLCKDNDDLINATEGKLTELNRWRSVYKRNKLELDTLEHTCTEMLSSKRLDAEKVKKIERRYKQIKRLAEKMQWLEQYGEERLGIEDACKHCDADEHELQLIIVAIDKLKE